MIHHLMSVFSISVIFHFWLIAFADAMIGSLGKGVVLKVSAVWFLPTIVGVVDRGRKVGCPLHVLLLSDIFIPLGQRHV